MSGQCVCDKCLVTDECPFYQEVVRPVKEIVNNNLNSKIAFIQKLDRALVEFECDANFRI